MQGERKLLKAEIHVSGAQGPGNVRIWPLYTEVGLGFSDYFDQKGRELAKRELTECFSRIYGQGPEQKPWVNLLEVYPEIEVNDPLATKVGPGGWLLIIMIMAALWIRC